LVLFRIARLMKDSLMIFLLLFGALQGLLVSFFLLKGKQKDPSRIFLVLFLVVAGLQLTFKVITKAWLMQNVFIFYKLSYCLPWLAGPLLYLFIRSRIRSRSWRASDAIHFLPFAVMLSLVLARHFSVYNVYFEFLFSYPLHLCLQLFALSAYGYESWMILKSAPEENTLPGLRNFLVFAIVSEALISITLTLTYVYFGRFPDVRWLFTALTLLIYWISYKLLSQPQLLVTTGAQVIPLRVENKYAHSGLKPEEAAGIADRLTCLMREKKLFLQPYLTIESLASEIGTTRHRLSQVINEHFHKSYFDFLAGLRVEEARSRLANPKFDHFTIAAIARDSGFTSVSSFNEAFKKVFRQTPSQFRSQRMNAVSA